MHAHIKDMWLAALRSGEYTKGTKTLCGITADGNKEFCCLGVLCDLATKIPELGLDEPEVLPDSGYDPNFRYAKYHRYGGSIFDGGASAVLPTKVLDWSGMKTQAGDLWNQGDDSLANINDRSDTFDAVIDVIEKNWETL